MDPAALLKAGPGRKGRDLLVAGPACGEVMLPLALVLGEKKFRFLFFRFCSQQRGCGCSGKTCSCWVLERGKEKVCG